MVLYLSTGIGCLVLYISTSSRVLFIHTHLITITCIICVCFQDKMREDLEQFDPTISQIEGIMKERETRIEDTKDKMNTVEDR